MNASLKHIFGILGLFTLSCSGNSHSVLRHSKVIHEELHLGEYLQKETEHSLITVNRSKTTGGLVRIKLDDDSLEVLDAEASEAREILLSEGAIAYRLEEQIRLWIDGKLQSFDLKAKKLRTHLRQNNSSWITWDNVEGQTEWALLLHSGTIESRGLLPGSARAHFKDAEGLQYFILQSDSLRLFQWRDQKLYPLVVIDSAPVGSYLSTRFFGGLLQIAYFDENEGSLKLAQWDREKVTNHKIDGELGKTYRGMDISIFDDRGQPGLIYLDAWALKLRWARLKKGAWVSEKLPLEGALGFYSQIISESSENIRLGFHSFRTLHSDNHQTFEDLYLIELKLD